MMDELSLFGSRFTIDEKKLISHIKRFLECAQGDPEFYTAVQEDAFSCGPLLQTRGIFGVDPAEAVVLLPGHHKAAGGISDAEAEVKPQTLLWQQYNASLDRIVEAFCKRSENTPNSRFNAWHRRQVYRCNSQLGKRASRGKNPHNAIAFELSKGCSIGCSFCGVAAERLQEVFLYTGEHARLWKSVLDVAVERLGAAAGSGICYWATEPSDNPDYFKFMKDFGNATGSYPSTTTAAPLRNPSWTKELMQFRREHPTIWDRFSILSTDALRRVHQLFSAEELAFTNLVLQNPGSRVRVLAPSGRNRKEDPITPVPDFARNYTIACLTGYLVNMADRSVRLISPCPPSDRWPFGYRVYTEGRFCSPEELDDFITDSIKQCMPELVAPDDILAFRRDLEFIPLPEGFQLRSAHLLHKMAGAPHMVQMGRLIAQGNLTSWKVIEEVMLQHPDIAAIISSIQKLFDQGLLEDGLSDCRSSVPQ
jgi:radical SAM family RiPP maturation amino acid epimerase